MPESRLLERFRNSELLTAEQIDELAHSKEAREADPRSLAKIVFQRGWLTRYQINQIAAGRGRELQVDKYVVLDRVGEGGMGQVYKARHAHMGRIVALKLMRKEKLNSARAVERFFIEVQAAAKLTHPNIVIAFDAGPTGSDYYFSMEFVEGTDLAQYVRKHGPLAIPQACDFVRQAALGLQHAHEQGMVHRDIKPANLLVTGGSSPLVKILDMGLASLGESFEKKRGLTATGKLLGTPDYLAPEQALDASKVDVRADIYSLGCTFFYLLTGRAPFRAESLSALLLKHQNEPPPPLRTVRPDAPPALEGLLMRMMAKKPEQRPATATEVATALEPLARGQPMTIAVPPPPPIDDAWAELTEEGDGLIARAPVRSSRDRYRDTVDDPSGKRRRGKQNLPLLVGGGIGAGVLLIATTIFAAVMMSRPKDSEKSTLVQNEKGDKNEKDSDSEPEVKSKRDEKKEITEGPNLLEPEPKPAIVERKGGHVAFKGHVRAVLGLAISPDGTRAASGGVNRSIIVWDLAGERELYRFDKLPAAVVSLAFSEDGNRLIGSLGDTLHEWDLTTGTHHTRPGQAGAFLSPNGKIALAFERDDGKALIRIVEIESGKERGRIDGQIGNVLHAFDRDSRRAIAFGKDRQLMRIDLGTGKVVDNLAFRMTGSISITSLSFGPREHDILVGRSDGFVHRIVWKNGATDEKINRRLRGAVRSITLSADGQTMLTTCDDDEVHLISVAAQPRVSNFQGNVGVPRRALYCLGDKKAVSADGSGTVLLLDLAKPFSTSGPRSTIPVAKDKPVVVKKDKPKKRDPNAFTGHESTVRNIVVSPDGKYLLSGGEDRTVRLWEMETGRPIRSFAMPEATIIRSVSFTPDGTKVLAVGDGKTGFAWETESGKTLEPFAIGTKGPATSIDVSLDGEHFAVTSAEGITGFLVSKENGWRAVPNRPYKSIGITRVASIDEGTLFALGYNNGSIRIADVQGPTPNLKPTIRSIHKGAILALAIAREREILVSAGTDGKVYLTSLRNGVKRPSQRLDGHTSRVTCLAVAPDGRQLVSGSADKTIRVWDIQTRRELYVFSDDEDEVSSVAFARDGKTVFAAAGKRIRYWPIAPDEP
jgi:serine/threonine protein kinase